MKRFVLAIVMACIMALLATTAFAASHSIKVGILLPLTGKHAKFGEIEKQSFEMAVAEINKAGGINGKKLELIIEDTQGKPDIGRSAIEKLITQDKVVMIGGGYSSSVVYAAAGVAVAKGFPFLVNTGSADKITEPSAFTPSGIRLGSLQKKLKKEKDPKKQAKIKKDIAKLQKRSDKEVAKILDRFAIFRLNPPVSEYASGMEVFLKEVVKPKTAVILHENSLFGTKGASSFAKTAKKLGIKVLFKESYDNGAIDFKPLLAKVKKADPDIVYMISYLLDASLLMRQSMELKMNPKMFVGGAAGFTLPSFSDNAGKASEKVVSATLWHQALDIPGAQAYYDNFLKLYDKQTEYHGAEAYSAAYVIADVLGRTKSHSPKDIKAALSATDMNTVFGPVKFISYDKKINQNKLETYVVQWIDGNLELVWPAEFASKKHVYPVNWIKERK
jgi:branched-chain amino acid transport system substrate-binding protein